MIDPEFVDELIEAPQGSAEWHAARLGKATASRMADLMARTKTGHGASRAAYMAELIVERLTGVPYPKYVSLEMRDGIEREPAARELYALRTGNVVRQVGFVPHPGIAMSGASPDGLIDMSGGGLVEIKCPGAAMHLETLLTRRVPKTYVLQCQWQMECTGRDWCNYVSYHPHFPAYLQMFVKRIERDEGVLETMRAEVVRFLEELDGKEQRLREMEAT